MNSIVVQYFYLGTFIVSKTHIAKSFVMNPFSTVSITDLSRVSENFLSSSFESSLALCNNPLVQAKMLAIELVEVYFPC